MKLVVIDKDYDAESNQGCAWEALGAKMVFSVAKRKMGSIVLARVPIQQPGEIIFLAFSCNSGRLEALLLLFTEDSPHSTQREIWVYSIQLLLQPAP